MFATYPNSFLQPSYHIAPSKISLNKPYSSPSFIKFHQPKIVAYATTTKQTKRPQQHSSTNMASTTSLYEVLGIPMTASGHEIKAAYRRLARMCHPDVVSINQKEMSTNEFMKIHTAYSTLSDPDKRASYDRDLFRRTRPYGSSLSSATMAAASSSMSRFSGYTCRNWETDQCW